MERAGLDGPERHLEYVVLGAGPAGLQMGYFLRRAGRDYLILESGDGPGTFFRSYPRHRTLISINKRFTGYSDPEVNLRWDWNSLLTDDQGPRFTDYSRRYFPKADRLVEYLEDFARSHDLRARYGTRVVRISRDGERFVLEDASGGRYSCLRLVVATGVSRPYVPKIPGIEHAESYAEASRDPEDYEGERVLILGKGNSAFETAEPLIETTELIHIASPASIRMAWQTHHVGHLRALNNNFLDTYQLKCQNAVLDADVQSIRRLPDGRLAVSVAYAHAEGECEELIYDRVIHCAGFRFDADIFAPSCRPKLVKAGRLPAQTSAWESVNVPDLFFAGTLMQERDYKRSASSFIHGFRYNVRTLHRLMERRYHGRDLPSRPVEPTPWGLAAAALERFNSSSALWQQFGYLADVLVVPSDGPARYYEELPLEWFRERQAAGDRAFAGVCFAATLEFGPPEGNPFRIERKPDPERAGESHFLHPVVRRLEGGRETARTHLLENLFGEWKDDGLHHAPLLAFFEEQLVAPAVAV